MVDTVIGTARSTALICVRLPDGMGHEWSRTGALRPFRKSGERKSAAPPGGAGRRQVNPGGGGSMGGEGLRRRRRSQEPAGSPLFASGEPCPN